MDQRAAEFAAQLMSTFKIEAEEHLKSLSDGLLALEGGLSDQDRKETVESIFREAHSLKGAARAVDLVKIQDICQSMENVLSELKHEKIQPTPPLFDSLYATIDLIGKCIRDPNAGDDELMQALAEKLGQAREGGAAQPPNPVYQAPNASAAPAPEVQDSSQVKTIRVDTGKLDTLMQEVEEMLLIKLVAGQRHNNLKHIHKELSLWEKGWSHMQKDLRKLRQAKEEEGSGYVPSKEFLDFIEQQPSMLREFRESIHSMSHAAAQDARLAGSMVDSLLEDTKKVLMQPFASLFEVLPRMVRDISHSLSKKINLTMSGSDIEVDRRILEEMKAPLIHLIRNSIDHGIEAPEDREKAKKPAQGEIALSVSQKSGNQVEITLTDDGHGIDIQQVKQTAVRNGMLTEKEAAALNDHEALMLIFKSGLSTSPIITELSGRGLGLGIVLEKVEKLGGTLNVESTPHRGTTFKITLPLTLATFRGVHVSASGLDFIFPTHNLTRVLRVKERDIQTAEGKETINLQGRILSYVHLSDLLQLPQKEERKSGDQYIYVLIIKALDTTVAVGVDQILNEQQVFVKGLGKQLVRVNNIAAATVMEWGKVIPILDPFDLVKSVAKVVGHVTVTPQAEVNTAKKTVLVAEDSVTARVLLKNILESAGFNVKTAVDGAEALSIVKVEDVDLLLSDVDMPRMDGFRLAESVRGIEKFKDLPIILCTSRGSREDREHGVEVGANAYIDKSSFTQSYLLDIIQKFF